MRGTGFAAEPRPRGGHHAPLRLSLLLVTGNTGTSGTPQMKRSFTAKSNEPLLPAVQEHGG